MLKITPPKTRVYRREILWHYVFAFVMLHLFAIYGIYELLCGRVQFKTFMSAWVLSICSVIGITAGAHRLWAHRTYKARIPLRILLAVFQSLAYQHNIFKWVRDHRVHHKFTDTDADPHNSSRGFFFSHIGWLLVCPHPDVVAKCHEMDMRDIIADPVVAFQRKYFRWGGPLVAFILPPLIPFWFWNENLLYSMAVVGALRYSYSLHAIFLVNSAAHYWGTKPYNKKKTAVENPTVSLLALGEGWHNYHHSFPWDYKTSELGNYGLNFTTAFIDMFACLGLAYDLKTAKIGLKRTKRSLKMDDGAEETPKTRLTVDQGPEQN